MYKLNRLTAIISFLFVLTINMQAQLPAKQENLVAYKRDVYGGVIMHSGGWGGSLSFSKFLTVKSKRIYDLEILGMKHGKETKIQGYVDQNSKDFVYGKLNSFLIVRLGYGTKYHKYEKTRNKGVALNWFWSIGPSIGFLKPVYLDVVNVLPDGTLGTPQQEAYNPENHNLSNIYGKSKGLIGLAETKVVPGGFAKFGIEFEYAQGREYIRAVETGVILDIYPKTIDLMANKKNSYIFPSIYLKLLIGKRYF